MSITGRGFIEAVQDWVASISTLGYTVPSAGVTGNITVGNLLDVDNLDQSLGSEIGCTLFDEGGTIVRTSRGGRQERTVRFVCKGQYGQQAVNSCWDIHKELESRKRFSSGIFSAWVARTDKLPTLIAADQGGTHLADFVVTFIVSNRIS